MATNKSQQEFFNSEDNGNKPVMCLGMTFKNDDERRKHFTAELRKRLPDLKKIEGCPIGEDEDILALSDPPNYTACPNPFISDFIQQWEAEKKEMYGEEEEEYHREPFAADVSEGKSDPIYMAHSYHTKVPHKAIMRYILHYTKPGDIIFDGFCGTGMTGVAAKMCGVREVVESLGYQVRNDGTIFKEETNMTGEKIWVLFSKLGPRHALLNDLAPAATYIAYNYNTPSDVHGFKRTTEKILSEIKQECEWMYSTIVEEKRNMAPTLAEKLQNAKDFDEVRYVIEQNKSVLGSVNYIIWSDVFVCSECTEEIVYWNASLDDVEFKLNDKFLCPYCNVSLEKNKMEHAWETYYDHPLKKVVKKIKKVPVLINYNVGKKRLTKVPDEFDIILIRQIESMEVPYWYPHNRMTEGREARRNDKFGLTNVHQFYTKRNLWVLASLWQKTTKEPLARLSITSVLVKTASLLHNVGLKKGKINLAGALPNSLYLPSTLAERNIIELVEGKMKDIVNAGLEKVTSTNMTYTMSLDIAGYDKPCVDYIFVDPPFGSNLMYKELNFLWEAWHKVFTENTFEAIEDKTQGKDTKEYHKLMAKLFKNAYKFLKPGRWMTVEFSNTKASVWNVIQIALQEAGFIVANVAALNKGQGTYNSQTNPTSVKQDLAISVYKPTDKFVDEMKRNVNTEQSIWIFLKQHLQQLPVFIGKKGDLEILVERTPRVLFDRVVAYHVQNGYPVPLSSAEFQAAVSQRFPMRDGMVFLEDQVAEYDKKRLLAKEFIQMNLFVSDENSAIEWLRQQLLRKPKTRQDLHPNFMKEIQHIAKHEELPELDELLEQNFLRYEGGGPVPSQIHGYLSTNFKDLRGLDKEASALKAKAKHRWYVPDPNKQADLEKLREKALLREFAAYIEQVNSSKKKLKQFRTEAIRAGFKKAWSDKDYKTIVSVGERLPEKVLQEDDKLLMYFDNAQIYLDM